MSIHTYTPAEVEHIARRLGGARKNGGGWDCRCPAHDDHEPSLSLSVGEDGRLLWCCHTGCDQADVLAGLRKRGVLLNGDGREAKPKAGKGRIVATYDYTDEQGGLLFQAVRYQPKDFKQRRPDGSGGWVWKLGDGRRVLYRLREVLTAEEVVLAEGEKDVDRLRTLGFAATTNPQGAGKWRPEYADTLAGKRVVVLPDNDEAGRKHAGKVAASLRGKAASVKVLELPGLPEKGDVSDWLDVGHTAEELRRLIDGAEERRPDWRTELLESDDGPLACEANVAIALRHAPELAGRLRFDQLGERVECSSVPWKACEGWRPWSDLDDTALAIWCQHQGVKVKPATCAAAVQLVAADHPHHPVRTYLDGLRWDGTPRLDTWAEVYLGAEVKPGREKYLRQVGRKTLIQPVARAYEPGCKADHLPVLRGPQGRGKSTAIRILAKEEAWFADEVADLGSKDSAQDLRGKWLIEIPELAAMRGREVERTKAFVSRKVDHYRPSYGHRSVDHPRQCVFWGTTNADSYLPDETGNRRFWDVEVGRIDIAKLRSDRDQLWAEAVAAFKAGEVWWLDVETEKLAAEVQEEHRTTDVWEEKLIEWALRRTYPFTIGEALEQALNVKTENQGRAEQMRVASALKAHGFARKRDGGGARQWRYRRATDPLNPDDTPGGGKAAAQDEKAPDGRTEDEKGSGRGRDGVGTPKTQQTQGSSQPSQPSQPFSHRYSEEGDVAGREDGVCKGFGNRLGRGDGWDGSLQGIDGKGHFDVPTSDFGLGRGEGRDVYDGCSDEDEPEIA